ncbi:MAG: M48 family metallopeptidase [Litoreibacter sp.]|nr:M48 family metallopeptidase [Litoreibacter sp.]
MTRAPSEVTDLELSGRACPPMQSRLEAARVVARRGEAQPILICARLADGLILTRAPRPEVQIDPPLGRTPRRLKFPDGTLFETEDHAGVELLEGRNAGGLLHRLEEFHPRLVGVVIIALAAIWLIWRHGLDVLVAAALFLTPPVLTEQIDAGTLRTLDLTLANPSDLGAEDQELAGEIFSDLLEALGSASGSDAEFQLVFRNMPGVGPNAFALPGGTVVLTDQFVSEFGDADILAGVLGHEIGHVVEQHGLKQVYRSLGIYILIAFMAGDTGPIIEEIILEGNLLLSLSYSRQHETAADRFGIELADRAGYDPEGLKSFFEALEGTGPELPRWMSTHPSGDRRVEEIDETIRSLR